MTEWSRDHVLVMQAAANLEATPEYARQLWTTASDPARAALELIALFAQERGQELKDATP